jgi:hypothetical protein
MEYQEQLWYIDACTRFCPLPIDSGETAAWICSDYAEGSNMSFFRNHSLVLVAAALLLIALTSSPVLAQTQKRIHEERSAEAMMADLVALRPLGIVGTAVGFAFFIVSSPFSALGGNIHESWEKLVKEPARYTFVRPLGAETY